MTRFALSFRNAFAAFVVAMAAVWPGAAATAVAAGHDEARWLCVTLQPDAAGEARLAELAALAGLSGGHDEAPAPNSAAHDCLACFAQAVALPVAVGPSLQAPGRVLVRVAANTAPVDHARLDAAAPARPRDPPNLI
ncbi:MAG: hypothetical protein AAFX09_09780 [Pseudomonadota bacterium]